VPLLPSPSPHRPRQVWLGLCLFLTLVICWLAFHPRPPQLAEVAHDKVNHLLAFAALGFTGALSRRPGWPGMAAVVGALLGFGGFIEMVQTQIPGRSGEWADVVADAVGVAIGLALATAWRGLAQKYF
jgi:VanZ family protein